MKTIYFVHDQQDQPFHRAHLLETAGYEVVLMKSGEECLQRLVERLPSLVLMDILIEGKHGFEVCRSIRTRLAPEKLPIVLCSDVYRARSFRDEAHNAGAQAFLLTPIPPAELLDVVARLTGTAAAIAQSA